MTATVWKDRVWERGTVTGTGTVSLSGTAQIGGFQSFTSAFTTGQQVLYGIFDSVAPAWEVGLGIFTTSGNTLSRATVLESSNAGALVTFAGNVCDIQSVITSPTQTSAGSGSQGKLAALNASGLIDNTMLTQVAKNGTDGSNIVTLSGSATLTAAQSGSIILSTGLTAAATYTLPTNAAGINYSIYGNGSYAVTVTAPAGSIVLPDGTSTASFVMPASYTEELYLVADGTNWRAITTGRAVVAQAVNANEAAQLGQVLGGISSNSYVNVTASRALGTTYTNSSGRPRVVFVEGYTSAGAFNLTATVGGIYAAASYSASGSNTGITFIVPTGATYSAAIGTGQTLTYWAEW